VRRVPDRILLARKPGSNHWVAMMERYPLGDLSLQVPNDIGEELAGKIEDLIIETYQQRGLIRGNERTATPRRRNK
jgi:hypothetical protein